MSDTIETQAITFSLIGGNLALDFSNTVGNRAVGAAPSERDEHLNSYDHLVAWARQTGVISSAEAGRLRTLAGQQPEKAAQALKRASALREAIYESFHALAHNERIGAGDLATLNAEFGEAASHLRLITTDQGLARGWPEDGPGLERVLWPVAWAASELLISEERDKVRQCADETCGWLFIDQSRNHSRQWCDMKDCGNKNKARRFYQRSRQHKISS